MKNIGLLLLFVSMLLSCDKQYDENISVIDLSGNDDHSVEIKLSQITNDLEFIFLETTDSCLIGNIKDIEVTEDYIFVSDLSKALLFTRQGKFITNIGSKGSGPGEYIQIMDCCFSSSEKEILMLCNSSQRKTYIYDLNGKFISEIKNDNSPSRISCLGSSIFYHVGLPSSYIYNDGFSINILDKNQLLKRVLKRQENFPEMLLSLNVSHFTKIDNNISIWEGYYDTIYYINESLKLTPRFTINHGKDYIYADGIFPMNEYRERLGNSNTIINLQDSRDYIFIERSMKRMFKNVIYDKTKQHLYHLENRFIINDIAGPKNFWPFKVLENNLICAVYYVSDLKETQSNNKSRSLINLAKNELFSENIKSKDINDNPCIVIADLKRKNSISQ